MVSMNHSHDVQDLPQPEGRELRKTAKQKWLIGLAIFLAIGLFGGILEALGITDDEDDQVEAVEEREKAEPASEESEDDPAQDAEGRDQADGTSDEQEASVTTAIEHDPDRGLATVEFPIAGFTYSQWDIWDAAELAYEEYPEAEGFRAIGYTISGDLDTGASATDDDAAIVFTCDVAAMAAAPVDAPDLGCQDHCKGAVYDEVSRTS